MEIEVAKLTTAFEGFAREFTRRTDRQDVTLASVLVEVRATNGRLTRAEEQIKALERKNDREREDAAAAAEGDAERLTLGKLKWYLAVAAGSFGGAWWLFERMQP